MILEIISEIQDPLEASSQVAQEEVAPQKKRASLVRGPSTFNLHTGSMNLRVPASPSRHNFTPGLVLILGFDFGFWFLVFGLTCGFGVWFWLVGF